MAKMNRREFLKRSAIGGASLAAAASGLSLATAQDIAYIRFLSQELDPPQVDAHRRNVRAFEALHSDIAIEIQYTTAEQVVERMIASLTAGVRAIDVIQPNPATAVGVAAQGYLLEIDDVVEAVGGDEFFYGNGASVIKLNGKRYGVPFGGGTVMIWYRKDLFEQEGITPPTTFEGLEAAARHFTKKFNPNSPTEYGIGLPGGATGATNFNIEPFWWSMGGDYFDKDLNIAFESDATADFLDWIAGMFQYASEAATGWTWGDLINTFLTGQSAMTIYLGRVLSRIYQNAPDLVGKVGVMNFPKDKLQITEDDPNYLVINAQTPFPEQSKEWVKFLVTGDASNEFLCTVPGHLPPATQAQQQWWDQAVTGCAILDENPEIKAIIGESVQYAYSPILHAGGVTEAIKAGVDRFVPTGVANPLMMAATISNLTIPMALQDVLLNGKSGRDAMMGVLPMLEQGVNQMKSDLNWGA
ncbi:MAG: extracellular solute-binding protein [Anaerolineae bacterium]|nr:extracellular solute-binding protein [Anaerolineae bacterium]